MSNKPLPPVAQQQASKPAAAPARFAPVGPERSGITRRVRGAIEDAAGARVGALGSAAKGTDRSDFDVDLLLAMRKPLSHMRSSIRERGLSEPIGVRVDRVPKSSIRLRWRDRRVEQAVAP